MTLAHTIGAGNWDGTSVRALFSEEPDDGDGSLFRFENGYDVDVTVYLDRTDEYDLDRERLSLDDAGITVPAGGEVDEFVTEIPPLSEYRIRIEPVSTPTSGEFDFLTVNGKLTNDTQGVPV